MPGPSRQAPAALSQAKSTVPAAPVVAASQPAVNRKKAKRRAKEAAKRAGNGSNPADVASPPISPPAQNGDLHVPGAFEHAYDQQGYMGDDGDVDDDAESGHGELDYSQADLTAAPRTKSKKKRKNRKASESIDGYDTFTTNQALTRAHAAPPIPRPPFPNSNGPKNQHKTSNDDRIWNSSTASERRNIKEFWLKLEEVERRSLVKVEKEAVLKKMKEQQKHSCSCSVCGRKRIAIEEELEVLYDAYYEELEQYAGHQVVLEDGTVITGRQAAELYPPLPSARLPPLLGRNGPRSRFQEEPDDDDDDDLTQEEGYSDEEDDGYDDDYSDAAPPQSAVEFFNFGNSLTVKGGILTVADDLLKNDGKKFIEMMEQLAERRMQREEEATYASQGRIHPNSAYPPHGAPLDDDDQYDDDEYATDDDEYDDEEEEEPEGLTEEQRMEEGRRMFQIFAARMFEQRVLSAYREHVAKERQDKLLEEIADEENRDAARDEKKQREAAKKKAKKLAQKQRLDEEKQRKDAEKQAAEAAIKAEEEKKAEELRLRKEEQKRKKDDEKKRLEEEKLRKEEERRKKLADARKAQDDADRKQREQKEKDRLKKEEARQKEREEREAKEQQAKERREAADKKERDLRAKAEKQVKEQAKKVEQAPKTAAQVKAAPTPAPALMRKQTSGTSAGPAVVQSISAIQANAQPSPHLQIATPVIPKAPSPARPRQASQQGSIQGSHQSSPKSSQLPSGSSATSPSTTQQVPAPNVQLPKPQPPHQMQPGFQQGRHLGQAPGPPPGMPFHQTAAPGMQPNGFPPFMPREPAGFSAFPPGFDQNMHGGNHFGAPFRYPQPNGIAQYPPGLNGMRPIGAGPPANSPSSATSPHHPTGPFGHQVPAPVGQRAQPHSRQPSASFDRAPDSAPAQPIGPPQHLKRQSTGPDDASKQLGSSALLGDDEPEEPARDIPGRSMAQGSFGPVSSSSNMFQRPFGHSNTPFGTPSIGGFGQSPSMPSWAPSAAASGSWGVAKEPFAPFGGRQHHNPALLRQLLCTSAKNLSSSPHTQANSRGGFHPLEAITREVNTMVRQPSERVSPKELLDLCDTIGNAQNGGGALVVHGDDNSGYWIRFEDDANGGPLSARGSVGDIGGQLPPHAQMMHTQQQPPHQGPSGGILPFGASQNGLFSGFGPPTRRGA